MCDSSLAGEPVCAGEYKSHTHRTGHRGQTLCKGVPQCREYAYEIMFVWLFLFSFSCFFVKEAKPCGAAHAECLLGSSLCYTASLGCLGTEQKCPQCSFPPDGKNGNSCQREETWRKMPKQNQTFILNKAPSCTTQFLELTTV